MKVTDKVLKKTSTSTKQGFTLVEVLIAISIMFAVLLLATSTMSLISTTLYNGQIESQNRVNLSDNIFFITREIQSAEKIIVEEKSLKIKQLGSDSFNLEYSIVACYPEVNVNGINLGSLNFKAKKALDLDYEKSYFSTDGNSVNITLAIVKSNLDFKQKPNIISFDVTARSEGVLPE